MRQVKASTARAIMVLMVDSTDHVTGKTGLSLTITASKAGAAFASVSPTVTERGSGWYSLALITAHLDTLGDLALHITGAAADPADLLLEVVAYDPGDAAALGLSRIDAAVSTRSTQASVDAVGGYLDTEVAAILAAVDTEVAAIKAKTDNLPTDPADESLLEAAIATRLASAGYTAPDNAGIAAIKAKTDNLPVDPADESSLQAAIATRAAPGAAMTLTGDYDAAKTAAQAGDPMALDSAAIDAILDEPVEGTVTLRQSIRVFLAVLAGKVSGAPSGPIAYRDLGDTKARVTGTIDEDGNRTAVVIDAE